MGGSEASGGQNAGTVKIACAAKNLGAAVGTIFNRAVPGQELGVTRISRGRCPNPLNSTIARAMLPKTFKAAARLFVKKIAFVAQNIGTTSLSGHTFRIDLHLGVVA